MGERAGFVIVAVGVKRVDAVEFPHFAVEFVFYAVHAVEFHKYGYGASGDFPTADAHAHTFGKESLLLPVLEERFHFLEEG